MQGIFECIEQILNILNLDGAHCGDLEDLTHEWTFSAVDDEAALTEVFAQGTKIDMIGEADGRDGIGEAVLRMEEGKPEIVESISEVSGFLSLEGETRFGRFLKNHFEGFVEGEEELDGWGIGGLFFRLSELEEAREAEVVISDGVMG